MYINQSKSINHLFFMQLALIQARKNLGKTKENPSVGCVITKKNSLIGVGVTGLGGRPHGEENAIKSSKVDLKNCNIYVTLEPCSHYGQTSPCTKKIINKKFKKVFFSVNDPDIRSFNKSKFLFNRANITVKEGILSNEINNFYRSYFKSKKSFFPFVSCKLAISKDFYTISKKNKWITNYFSRARGHLIRSQHDCIMTSNKTIMSDNSRLTCRIDGLNNVSPSRIILDNKLKISLKSNIVQDASKFRTIIFYNKFNKEKINKLKKLKVEPYKISLDEKNNLDLYQVLFKAKSLGFYRILLESGFTLVNSFLYKKLINDIYLFISNKNLGISGKNNIKRNIKFFLRNKKGNNQKINLFGDKLITYKII